MRRDWDAILADFLLGAATAAELRDVLLQIDMPADARSQVDEALALHDAVADACQAIPESSAAAERMMAQLRQEPAPEGGFVRKAAPRPTTPILETDPEEALLGAYEKTMATDDLQSIANDGEMAPELREELEESLKLIAALDQAFEDRDTLSDYAGRALAALRAAADEGRGLPAVDDPELESEEGDAAPILRIRPQARMQRDVLAASKTETQRLDRAAARQSKPAKATRGKKQGAKPRSAKSGSAKTAKAATRKAVSSKSKAKASAKPSAGRKAMAGTKTTGRSGTSQRKAGKPKSASKLARSKKMTKRAARAAPSKKKGGKSAGRAGNRRKTGK